MRLIQHVELDPSWPEMGARADATDAPIRLADVEALLPAGEARANVYFLLPDKTRMWPWKEAGYYVDDDGEPMAPVFNVVPMTRHQLEGVGLTDEKLWAEYARLFPDAKEDAPRPNAPDTSKLQVARRRVYDAVTAAWYAI